jgi:hypothetical protein
VKNKQPGGGGKHSRLLATGILLGIGAIEPLWAGESAYGLGYSAEHSDNITLVSSNERSDWIHSLVAGFAYQENTIDLVARVLAQATYNHYQKNSFGDETLFDLNSSAVWTISPQRLHWTLEDSYQQGLVDSTGTDTPANRTNVNVLSTGPDVYLRLAPVHTLAFGARAGDVYTGRVNADNKRFSGSAAWLYQSSSITTLSLNYQALGVRYENSTLNNDYKSEDVFFRADFRPSLSQYLLDLGATHINFDRGDDVSGTLARLSWIRQSTPESSFGASISKEFSDTGTDVLAATTAANPASGATGGPGATSGQTSIVTGDVYTTKGGTIFYNHRGSQLGVQFQTGKRKLDFETTPQDRKETNGHLQFDYFFPGATMTAALFTEYTKTEYLDVIRRDTERNTGIRLDQYLSRTVSLGLEGRHHDRTSTISSSNYVDNRVLFTLLYSSGPLFTPLRRR